jgi:hypothetical protein
MPSISSSPQEEVGQSHLSRHTGSWSEVWGVIWGIYLGLFGVSLRLQMHGGPRRLVGPQRFRLLLPLLRLSLSHTWFFRRLTHLSLCCGTRRR